MPKIFEYSGFIFPLYSNDYKPLHVHVRYAKYESVTEENVKKGSGFLKKPNLSVYNLIIIN